MQTLSLQTYDNYEGPYKGEGWGGIKEYVRCTFVKIRHWTDAAHSCTTVYNVILKVGINNLCIKTN